MAGGFLYYCARSEWHQYWELCTNTYRHKQTGFRKVVLKTKTVFVIGAGCGPDYGLPIGRELATKISKSLDFQFDDLGRYTGGGNTRILQHLREAYRENFNLYRQACRGIQNGIHLTDSIDDFLNLHQADDKTNLCGKIAISQAILEAESASDLYVDTDDRRSSINFPKLANTWLVKLFKILGRQSTPERVFENVDFINFNYDRCLEYFFPHALRTLFKIPIQEANAICLRANIIHPYGTVGMLPNSGAPQPIEFGNTEADLGFVAQGIKTYTEQARDEDAKLIKGLIQDADAIVFLGFAFHEQNMKLLASPEGTTASRVFATAYLVSDDDCEVIRRDIFNLYGKRTLVWVDGAPAINLRLRKDLNCSGFFDAYSRTLTSE